MNKYYNSVVDAKNWLIDYFEDYDNYNNPININDFINDVRKHHSNLKTIKDRMAFVMVIAATYFSIYTSNGDIIKYNLPGTKYALENIDTNFKRYYRKKRLYLFCADDWFPEEEKYYRILK